MFHAENKQQMWLCPVKRQSIFTSYQFVPSNLSKMMQFYS